MAEKNAKKASEKDIRHAVIVAAMALAAEKGWEGLSLRDVAREAGISIAALYGVFEDKDDILVALGREIDRAVLENISDYDETTSVRDRLFDILMDRYDALNDYRGGLCAVLESFKCDPKQAVISFPHLCRSMNWMLEAAGVDTSGIKGAVKVAGLTGLYLKVLRVWKEDDSRDLAKTMAALDKALGRAENFVQSLGL
ncbi:MAG: TetR/AcrR family transcriptional regulator [Alphaproteobacteria bacterium]|nr:TetR/AcrR family transcriptional regulator [Alphaproteobacteria bacterium]